MVLLNATTNSRIKSCYTSKQKYTNNTAIINVNNDGFCEDTVCLKKVIVV